MSAKKLNIKQDLIDAMKFKVQTAVRKNLHDKLSQYATDNFNNIVMASVNEIVDNYKIDVDSDLSTNIQELKK